MTTGLVTKKQAQRRLEAAGHHEAAAALAAYRSFAPKSDGKITSRGWDGWLRKAYPETVLVIWPGWRHMIVNGPRGRNA